MVRRSISLATSCVPTISTTRSPRNEIELSPRSTISRFSSPSASGRQHLDRELEDEAGDGHPREHAVARRLAEGVAAIRPRSCRPPVAGVERADFRSGRHEQLLRAWRAAGHRTHLGASAASATGAPRRVAARRRARPRSRADAASARGPPANPGGGASARRARAADLDPLRAALYQLADGGEARQRPFEMIATRSHSISTSGQDVRREQHRGAAIALLEDQLAHVAAAERIEPAHRLVQNEQLRDRG